MDTNIVVIEGRLTKNAEMKTVGKSNLISFSVANNQGYFNKETNAWVSKPSFFDCALWNHEKMFQHLQKGRMVTVTGKLVQDSWTDNNGQTHYKITISADNLSLRYDKKEVSSSQVETGEAQVTPAQTVEQQNQTESGLPEDFPF